MGLLELNDYGPKDNQGYSYNLVVKDNFNEFGWQFQWKYEIGHTIKNQF